MAFLCSVCHTNHNNLQFRRGSTAAHIELDNYNHLGDNDRMVIIQGILLTPTIFFLHTSSFLYRSLALLPLHDFLVLLVHCHSRSSGDDV